MGLAQTTKGIWDPSTSASITVGPYTTAGLYRMGIDQSAMGAGDTITLSMQQNDTGTYLEGRSETFGPPVAIPAAPAAGYQPLFRSPSQDWDDTTTGIQYVLTYTTASGNTTPTAVDYFLNGIT